MAKPRPKKKIRGHTVELMVVDDAVGIDISREGDKTVATIAMVQIDTAGVMTLKSMESHEVKVDGSFVKFSPDVKASMMQAFDAADRVRELLAAGARGVVLAPIVVPDDHRVEAAQEQALVALTPDQAVDRWFGRVTADATIAKEARELVARFMSEEGL